VNRYQGIRLWAIAAALLLSNSCGTRDQEPFSIVMLPDTQFYSERLPEYFHDQTRWVADHGAEENVVFVTHVGDIVNNGDERPEEWEVANEAMSRLDGIVPWGVAIGNHDYDRGEPRGRATKFLEVFGPARYEGQDAYQGASANGLNTYHAFKAGGSLYLIFHMEADIPDETIAWAESVMERHRLPTIVSTHIYLDDRTSARTAEAYYLRDRGNSGEEIWQKFIRKNPQIFMVLCGHWATAGGEWRQVSKNDAGGDVFEVLADYQTRENGGDGWLRIIRFEPAENKIWFRTYSPSLEQHESDQNSEFVFFVDFDDRFGLK
jgi:hypothetical protein